MAYESPYVVASRVEPHRDDEFAHAVTTEGSIALHF